MDPLSSIPAAAPRRSRLKTAYRLPDEHLPTATYDMGHTAVTMLPSSHTQPPSSDSGPGCGGLTPEGGDTQGGTARSLSTHSRRRKIWPGNPAAARQAPATACRTGALATMMLWRNKAAVACAVALLFDASLLQCLHVATTGSAAGPRPGRLSSWAPPWQAQQLAPALAAWCLAVSAQSAQLSRGPWAQRGRRGRGAPCGGARARPPPRAAASPPPRRSACP